MPMSQKILVAAIIIVCCVGGISAGILIANDYAPGDLRAAGMGAGLGLFFGGQVLCLISAIGRMCHKE